MSTKNNNKFVFRYTETELANMRNEIATTVSQLRKVVANALCGSLEYTCLQQNGKVLNALHDSLPEGTYRKALVKCLTSNYPVKYDAEAKSFTWNQEKVMAISNKKGWGWTKPTDGRRFTDDQMATLADYCTTRLEDIDWMSYKPTTSTGTTKKEHSKESLEKRFNKVVADAKEAGVSLPMSQVTHIHNSDDSGNDYGEHTGLFDMLHKTLLSKDSTAQEELLRTLTMLCAEEFKNVA